MAADGGTGCGTSRRRVSPSSATSGPGAAGVLHSRRRRGHDHRLPVGGSTDEATPASIDMRTGASRPVATFLEHAILRSRRLPGRVPRRRVLQRIRRTGCACRSSTSTQGTRCHLPALRVGAGPRRGHAVLPWSRPLCFRESRSSSRTEARRGIVDLRHGRVGRRHREPRGSSPTPCSVPAETVAEDLLMTSRPSPRGPRGRLPPGVDGRVADQLALRRLHQGLTVNMSPMGPKPRWRRSRARRSSSTSRRSSTERPPPRPRPSTRTVTTGPNHHDDADGRDLRHLRRRNQIRQWDTAHRAAPRRHRNRPRSGPTPLVALPDGSAVLYPDARRGAPAVPGRSRRSRGPCRSRGSNAGSPKPSASGTSPPATARRLSLTDRSRAHRSCAGGQEGGLPTTSRGRNSVLKAIPCFRGRGAY